MKCNQQLKKMMNHFLHKTTLVFMLILFISILNIHGQSIPADSIDIYEMTIEQLQQTKAHGVSSEMEKLINSVIEGSSKKAFSYRESPNTISLITAEDIEKSGARNMTDLLRTVSGIEINTDVQGVLGVGMRGLWAQEAKILFIVNGMEINEPLFGAVPVNSGFNLNDIKRIEIIRGPGSVIYGGRASYGVVNIITKDYEQDCVSVNTTQGITDNGYASNTIGFMAADKAGDTKINFSSQYEKTIASDRNYMESGGNTVSLKNYSQQESFNTNLTIQKNQLSIKYIFSNYKISSPVPFGLIINKNFYTEFLFNNLQVKNTYKLTKSSNLVGSFAILQTTPWKNKAYEFLDITSYHTNSISPRLNITHNQTISKKINISTGGEYLVDDARHIARDTEFNFANNHVDVTNIALFSELCIKWRLVNLIAGLRYDHQNFAGDALAPRIAFTGKYNKWNYKLIGSRAFKSPTIENINLSNNQSINPEFTYYSEFEMGYNFTKSSYFSFNLFDIETQNPIVYFIDIEAEGQPDFYFNYGASASQGFELEYAYKRENINLKINYSYYTAQNNANDKSIFPPIKNESFVGFANHKIAFNGNLKLKNNLFLGATAQYFSPRYAATGVDFNGNSTYTKINESLLINSNLLYKNLLIGGLDLSLNCSNITSETHYYIQPYKGDLSPSPNLSREYRIKIVYSLPLKKMVK